MYEFCLYFLLLLVFGDADEAAVSWQSHGPLGYVFLVERLVSIIRDINLGRSVRVRDCRPGL